VTNIFFFVFAAGEDLNAGASFFRRKNSEAVPRQIFATVKI
jgi:hypothetical protein